MEAIVKQVAAIAVGVPSGLFLLYIATRVISRAWFRTRSEWLAGLFSKEKTHGPE